MLGLIITGGESPESAQLRALVQRAEIIVAADSGLDTAIENHIQPDLIVGDFDSTAYRDRLEEYQGERISSYSEEKDFTDTELAIEKARQEGATEIIIAGGGGGRLDHLLAIYSIFMRRDPPMEWHSRHESCICIRDSYSARQRIGKRISLFPISEGVVRMKSEGLQWPLDSLSWKYGDLGISNVTVEEEFRIDVKSGRLLLVYDTADRDRR